jgi:uncharacterized DUF497 family protein
MDYEWDAAKELANVKRHGVEFAEAVLALEGSRFPIPMREARRASFHSAWTPRAGCW